MSTIRMHKNPKSSESSSSNTTNSSANIKPVIEGIKDIEELRKSYELPHHWALRKEFIQIYSDKFDQDRLVCLSNVFVNVECMGLTYPDDVMKLIKELGKQVRGLESYKHQLERDEPELPRKQAYNQHQRRQRF